MAISFVGSSNTTYASRTDTVVSGTLSAGSIQDDDVLVFTIFTGQGVAAPNPTPPDGLEQAGETADRSAGGFNGKFSTYIKVASGESGDYTFTHLTCSSQGSLHVLRGVDTTTPQDAAATSNGATGVGETTSTFTGLTTATAGAWLVGCAHDWADSSNDLSPPTGMTERQDGVLTYVCTEEVAVAGATGDRTYTNNNSPAFAAVWATVLLALRPYVEPEPEPEPEPEEETTFARPDLGGGPGGGGRARRIRERGPSLAYVKMTAGGEYVAKKIVVSAPKTETVIAPPPPVKASPADVARIVDSLAAQQNAKIAEIKAAEAAERKRLIEIDNDFLMFIAEMD